MTGETVTVLPLPAGVALSPEQAQRLTCFALTLHLVSGRSVPIQVVERISAWIYSGEAEP